MVTRSLSRMGYSGQRSVTAIVRTFYFTEEDICDVDLQSFHSTHYKPTALNKKRTSND